MRNIPVFSTDLGVASLVLDQIPYSGTAFVHICSTAQPEKFITECAGFCRAAGADLVLATGHEVLKEFPIQYEILSMRRPLEGIADTDAALMPVTEQTLDIWVQHYNKKMMHVDGAAYMSNREGKKLLEEGRGYFVHRSGQLLGIGKASGETLDAIASIVPGEGRTVVCALCHCLSGPMVDLQVASTNRRAIRLYEDMGFLSTGVKRRWHRI